MGILLYITTNSLQFSLAHWATFCCTNTAVCYTQIRYPITKLVACHWHCNTPRYTTHTLSMLSAHKYTTISTKHNAHTTNVHIIIMIQRYRVEGKIHLLYTRGYTLTHTHTHTHDAISHLSAGLVSLMSRTTDQALCIAAHVTVCVCVYSWSVQCQITQHSAVVAVRDFCYFGTFPQEFW